jgi:hypothetical protein
VKQSSVVPDAEIIEEMETEEVTSFIEIMPVAVTSL